MLSTRVQAEAWQLGWPPWSRLDAGSRANWRRQDLNRPCRCLSSGLRHMPNSAKQSFPAFPSQGDTGAKFTQILASRHTPRQAARLLATSSPVPWLGMRVLRTLLMRDPQRVRALLGLWVFAIKPAFSSPRPPTIELVLRATSGNKQAPVSSQSCWQCPILPTRPTNLQTRPTCKHAQNYTLSKSLRVLGQGNAIPNLTSLSLYPPASAVLVGWPLPFSCCFAALPYLGRLWMAIKP